MINLVIAKAWHKLFVDKVDAMILDKEMVGSDQLGRMCDDTQCKLGRWLFGEGQELVGIPAFDSLRNIHERFHQHSCMYLSASLGSDSEKLNNAREDFHLFSTRVISAIDRLEEYVRAARQTEADAYPDIAISSEDALEWDDALTLGLPVIDEQHKAIMSVFNKLIDIIEIPQHPGAITDFLTDIGPLLEIHFRTEEVQMKNLGMSEEEFEAHRKEHLKLQDAYVLLNMQLMEDNKIQAKELLDTARKWTIDHVVEHDLNIRKYLVSSA